MVCGDSLYPHLIGSCNPRWDTRATAHILGLTLGSTRAAIYRGILEGIAVEFSHNYQILCSVVSSAIGEIRVSGGGASSDLGLRLRAAAAGVRIRPWRSREASCRGAAILAGVGSGAFKSVREALPRERRFERCVDPEPLLAEWFQDFEPRYSRQLEALLDWGFERPDRAGKPLEKGCDLRTRSALLGSAGQRDEIDF